MYMAVVSRGKFVRAGAPASLRQARLHDGRPARWRISEGVRRCAWEHTPCDGWPGPAGCGAPYLVRLSRDDPRPRSGRARTARLMTEMEVLLQSWPLVVLHAVPAPPAPSPTPLDSTAAGWGQGGVEEGS